MGDIKSRIIEFINYIGISKRQFLLTCGFSESYLNNMSKGLSYEAIDKIKAAYPELSMPWMVLGEGNMLNSAPVNKIAQLSEVITSLGITKTEFANKIGIKEYNVDKMLSGELPIGANALRKLESVFGINPEWIARGVGSMFKGEATKNKPQRINNSSVTPHAIKYYPSVNGSMGGVEFLDNPNEASTDIIIPGFSDCKFAVNAYGDSMHPVIKSGQIVVMMEWKESFIDWGRIYFVVTKNGYRAIKYLRPSENEGCIKCESENAKENPAFDVEINDIHKLFLVKGWICREAI